MIIQKTIEDKVQDKFAPSHLEVINESHIHNVPAGSESHFKLVIVSDFFAGLSKVKRQQAVYAALSEELAGAVHALSMKTYSLDEWQQDPAIPASPPCLGGSKTS